MVTGTVKFYNVKKAFGFIAGDDGKDYFVHASGLVPGTRLYQDDQVEFETEDGDKGPKAVNVKKPGNDLKPQGDVPAENADESQEAAEEELA